MLALQVSNPVRSNTHYVHSTVTPFAAWQLNHRFQPHGGIKGCGDCTIVCVGFLILESKETGRCCCSMLLPQGANKGLKNTLLFTYDC